jgi:hypothetical protein
MIVEKNGTQLQLMGLDDTEKIQALKEAAKLCGEV